jgi:hypothetical protein
MVRRYRLHVNEAWHRANPMPRNATFEQRLAWHREHARECACRQPPGEIAAALAGEPNTEPPPTNA